MKIHPSRSVAALASLAAGSLVPGFAQAHHSFAMFDQSRVVTINGAVKSLQWTNPHVVIWVDAEPKGGGAPEMWTVELTSPGNLTRMGWTRHSVSPGDRVAVDIAPLRDGGHGGGLDRLTILDTGKVLTANPQALERSGGVQ